MERLETPKSGYLILKDHDSGQWYVGRLELDPDGIICPCSRDSEFFDTIEQANRKLGEINGAGNVG